MAETLILNPTQLRMGDVVLDHGMRIKLDRAPTVTRHECHHGPGTYLVYSWPGLVLNPFEAIEQYAIPYGFIFDASDHWEEGVGWVRATRPAWTVQGNHLARVAVEREHVIGC